MGHKGSHLSNNITPARVAAILERYNPAGWKVSETPARERNLRAWLGDAPGKSFVVGRAYFTRKLITVPKLDDIEAIATYLHECGHVLLRHCDELGWPCLPLHVMEYEAETFSIGILHVEGLRVTKRLVEGARQYVRDCIAVDRKEGLKIRGYVERWARGQS